jgi:hypothetical protein
MISPFLKRNKCYIPGILGITIKCFECLVFMYSYPDKEAGQYPMAYVVRKDGISISESQVMEFVAGQVC